MYTFSSPPLPTLMLQHFPAFGRKGVTIKTTIATDASTTAMNCIAEKASKLSQNFESGSDTKPPAKMNSPAESQASSTLSSPAAMPVPLIQLSSAAVCRVDGARKSNHSQTEHQLEGSQATKHTNAETKESREEREERGTPRFKLLTVV